MEIVRSRAKLAALAGVVLLVAVAAGCGGGGGSGSGGGGKANDVAGAGAAVLPAGTPAFVALSTDFQSDPWKQVQALGAKFPGYQQLLDQGRAQLAKQGLDFEKDIVPALGPEVDFAFLDFQNKGDDFVAVTKPDDPSKLDAVLKKSKTPPVTTTVDGWVVIAQKQAQLDAVTGAKDKLADDQNFKDAMASLPGGDVVRLYLNGSPVQDALSKALKSSTTSSSMPFQLPTNLAKLDWAAVSGVPQSDGAQFVATAKVEPTPKVDTFTAELPKSFASGAIVYAGFANLDQPLKQLYDALGKSSPDLGKQLGQLEGVSGISLDTDVVPLFKNEGGVALYPGTGTTPTVVFALKVDDEAKVSKLLDQLGALVALAGGGGGAPTPVTVPGYTNAKQLKLGTTSLYYGTANGMLVVSNEQAGLQDVNGSGAKLADDTAFKAAQDAAGMPDKTTGFVYADLKTGLPAILGLAKTSGTKIPDTVTQNIAPLQSALFYGSLDGDLIKVTGFVGVG